MKKFFERIKQGNVTFFNMICSLFLKGISILSGVIMPGIILRSFGSGVNGIVSSANQFLSYISLLEGGITSVISANMYKPLIENDSSKLSSVFNTAKGFYIKIGCIYSAYAAAVAVVFPRFFDSEFSNSYVSLLIVILSLNLFVEYVFSLTNRTLLIADKKIYVVSLTQAVLKTANILLVVLSVRIYPSIHLVEMITSAVMCMQMFVYNASVRKNYSLDKTAARDKSLLSQRWNGFAINTAAFIHNSTDATILAVFADFLTVSVYSVYGIVSNGLKQVTTSITDSFIPVIGQAYARGDEKELNEKMDCYEMTVFWIVYLLFSVAGLLITPFVMIYTKDINDADYCKPLFGALILLSEAIYLIKLPHLNLSYTANKFKEIEKIAFAEAAINIIISLLLVKKFGLAGVAAGTCAAMLFRMVFQVRFTEKLTKSRKQFVFYKKLIVFSAFAVIGYFICGKLISPAEANIPSFIIHGIIYCVVFGLLYLIAGILFFGKEIRSMVKFFGNKGGNN